LNDQINERSRPQHLQDEPLRSLDHAAKFVDCFDDLFRSGGQRAPPLKLKEHTPNRIVLVPDASTRTFVLSTGKAVKNF
jgi:hypothetical protein